MTARPSALHIEYPDSLPITAARDEIAAAIAEHPVLIVCGDTGSGKTTQLPKLCLDAGRGESGLIGHTQPRRVAARAVARRLASELRCRVGAEVGYHVRFNERTDARTRIKVMTDGILLNEIRTDRELRAYDTLIIDEAHERSLNVDFLLGYLKLLLEARSDLKLVITSATVDPGSFAAYFGGAPVIEVPGKRYPISFDYRPPAEDEDLGQAVVAACNALAAEPIDGDRSIRDILVFLPGERWIRDTERALGRDGPEGYEIVPLYARLPAGRQDRVFDPGPAPRVVLATNVAETSLTVPRIRYVVDSGLARISRYSARHRIQTLAVEPIAQANAIQRAGRCGRLAPGRCVRLYAEDDFAGRAAFMDPEILRTNLAGVILRLESLGLGHIDRFPFLDPPPDKAVNDAFRLLEVLGALDARGRLTRDGRRMGRLPLDPRLARLLIVGERRHCLDEALTLAAVLGTGDPREQPVDKVEQAREAQAEITDPRSDFMTYLALWRGYLSVRGRNARAFRGWCRSRYLSANRLREWDDVRSQLEALLGRSGGKRRRSDRRGPPGHSGKAEVRKADYATIHHAVIAAFVDFIAERDDDGTYRGMHGARASLFPGTAVAKRRPAWVVAAEHVATERNYLRVVATINPRWVLRTAPHLVKREYLEPHWDRDRGKVTVREKATAFGLVLSRQRRVDYGPIDPLRAREIFIRDALAADNLGEPLDFIEHNRSVKRRILDWEARTRSRDLYIGNGGLEAVYTARLPAGVLDRRGLAAWCKEDGSNDALKLDVGDLATRDAGAEVDRAFPTTFELGGQALELRYRYEPGHDRDGVTLRLPRMLLDIARAEQLDWLVPGALREKVLALLKTLPKEARRPLVPLPDTVDALLPDLLTRFGQGGLIEGIRNVLLEVRGQGLPGEALRPQRLPPHLRMGVELLDETGKVVDFGRGLAALQRRHGGGRELGARTVAAAGPWERRGLVHWECGDLPASVELERYGTKLELYPALIDRRRAVDLALLAPGPAAVERHREGVRRLALLELRQQTALIRDRMLVDRQLLLAFHGIGSTQALVDDLLLAAADESFALDRPSRGRAEFRACVDSGRADIVERAERLLDLLHELLPRYRALRTWLDSADPANPARGDIAGQLDGLIHSGFLSATPPQWRSSLPRFLQAMQIRCEKLRSNPRDARHQAEAQRAWARYAERRDALPPDWPLPAALVRYRWLVEELRVSLFAQALGTSTPVSSKRLEAYWGDNIREMTL